MIYLHEANRVFNIYVLNGDTIGSMLIRINKFRNPDNQITVCYLQDGTEVSNDFVIQGKMEIYIHQAT
jgi:hypothetical protein